jgi:hypothetical protein
MRYMMLIYSQEDESVTHDDMSAVAAAHRAVRDEARQRGVFCAAEPLQASVTATTLRVHDGATMVTDGPFAETKEQLAGYYILDCEDLDEALAWAARIPTACAGRIGCVEVRPIREFPQSISTSGVHQAAAVREN